MTGEIWRLDEVARAGREHLAPEYVAAFDRKSPIDWTDDLAMLRDCGVGAASTVVDLGAGTGSFATAIAPHAARVVAVDVSEAMVAAIHNRGIEAVRAGFLDYEHEGEPADAVFSRNALHHLPDFWKAIALDRIARLLRPGRVFLLRDIVFSFDPPDAGRDDRGMAGRGGDRLRDRLDGRAARRARPRGAFDLHVAARADARARRLRDPRPLDERESNPRRLHVRLPVGVRGERRPVTSRERVWV